jgi:hypothetical protein
MHNLNALKRLVKKITGNDSNAKSIRGAIDEINTGYIPSSSITKLSDLTNDVGFITESDIPVASNQADSTAEDVAGLVTDFNGLLAKLKAAGIMEDDS